jgi:hypothetical protein
MAQARSPMSQPQLGKHTLHLAALKVQFTSVTSRPFWQQRIKDAWRETPIPTR